MLFFVGPAFACRGGGGGIFETLEKSLGSVPGHCARVCTMWFLVAWIGTVMALAVTWQLPFIVRGEVSRAGSGAVAVLVLAFLFVSGLQSARTSARLAVFTNKLALAVLIAALLRVQDGWAAVLAPLSSDGSPGVLDVWSGMSRLGFAVGPVAFLAADFAGSNWSAKHIGRAALMGVALPVGVGLFLVGVMNAATLASGYYQPSLEPNLAMALWGQAAGSSLPPRMMLTAITCFGALRFGAKSLAVSLAAPGVGLWWRRAVLASSVLIIAWLAVKPSPANRELWLALPGACLIVFAAVIAADAVSGRFGRVKQAKRVDWVGVSAVMAGLAAGGSVEAWVGMDAWLHAGVFPAYFVAFGVCWCGRRVADSVGRYIA